ncbi:bifunctional phosphoribosyl-AMP cyclohydrolase/phosphoribosyl-ATP diphosphatase HisIE [soil metagenome]
MSWIEQLKFDESGLIPVVTQEVSTGTVLMLAYANREALERTAARGRAHYWSRSRQVLWEKGGTSGNTQEVREIRADCDGDAVLYRVHQSGPACHTGETSCFHRVTTPDSLESAGEPAHILARLETLIGERDSSRAANSYTTYLFESGTDKVLKKIGEEATEVVIAAKNANRTELRGEVADLLFHLLVMLRQQGLPLEALWDELDGRFGRAARRPRETSATHTHS